MNKYTSAIFFVLTFLVLNAFSAKTALAADQTISCDNSGCSGIQAGLFNEAGIAPGTSYTKTLEIKNNRDKPIDVSLKGTANPATEAELSNTMDIEAGEGSTVIGTETLKDFFGGSDINLGTEVANSTREIYIKITFGTGSNNDYQNKSLNFDLALNITGDDTGNSTSNSSNEGTSTSGTTTNNTNPTPTPNPLLGGLVAGISTLFNPTASSSPQPQVLGTSNQEVGPLNAFPWWLPLIIFLLLLLLAYIIGRYFRQKSLHLR